MEGLDVVALCGLEWVFDKVEDRWGLAAAWLVTGALAATVLGGIVAILFAIL